VYHNDGIQHWSSSKQSFLTQNSCSHVSGIYNNETSCCRGVDGCRGVAGITTGGGAGGILLRISFGSTVENVFLFQILHNLIIVLHTKEIYYNYTLPVIAES
jgi:hypothetical protein